MKILLTNDDGIFAPGISVLYNVLSADNRHEIYIVAPEGQRSAVGRSITIYHPLFVTRHQLKGNGLGLAVKGTPTDCVKLALQGDILPNKPDMIISGINNGPNLGADVFYSGTVAAAMEGVLLGVPSLAVSLACYEQPNYLGAARFVKRLLDNFSSEVGNSKGLLNINIPGTEECSWKGIKTTKLGRSMYDNFFENRTAPFGEKYYWFTGKLVYTDEQDTDLQAVRDGYISVTPMHNDLTDYERMAVLKKIFEESEKYRS